MVPDTPLVPVVDHSHVLPSRRTDFDLVLSGNEGRRPACQRRLNGKRNLFVVCLMTFSGLASTVGAPLVEGRVSAPLAPADGAARRGAGSLRAPDARPEPSRTVAAPTCTQSLQALIDATPPGGGLQLPGCVFRASAAIERPISVVGSAGTEIRGSDVWTSWRASNGRWISADPLPSRDAAGECRADQPDCGQRRQVFVDGRRLVEAAEPSATNFAVTADEHVALGFDPAGRTVEVSVRDRWLDVRAAGVTIRAVTFRHAINAPQAEQAALRVEASDAFSLVDSTLADAHGSLLGVDGGSRLLVQGNDLGEAGQEGFAITRATDGLVAQNRIHDNNTAGFDPEWEAGGGKATRLRGVRFESNEVTNNAGPGLWCDIDCEHVTMSRNRVSGNERAGLFYEISIDGRISDNVVWSNGWGKTELGWGAGILISSSGATTVDGNIVAWNADGISVVSQDRDDASVTAGSAIEVRDNLVVVGQDASRPYALAWLDDGGPSLSAAARGNAAG